MFGKKRLPALTEPPVVALLEQATRDMNYGAVQDLYGMYRTAAPAGPPLWAWWLDRAEEAARAGHRDIAALACDFARKANIEPWGDLGRDDYARLRAIEAI